MICWIISKMACSRMVNQTYLWVRSRWRRKTAFSPVVRVNRRDRKLGGRGVTTTARVCWRNSYASKMWRGIVS